MVCGLFGVLQKRKSVLPLLKVAERQPHDWFFVFAGQMPRNDYSESEWNYIHQFIETKPGNCYFWAKSIPEIGFNSAVAASDMIFAAYEFFPHSSNVMTKAALFQKPIMVSPGFLMAERVKAFRLGWVLPSLSVDSIFEILKTLNKEGLRLARQAGLFSEYLAQHDDKRLTGVLNKAVNFCEI